VSLPDFPFESRFAEVEGLRLAYLDEGAARGDGPGPVVMWHGEPTWSYLWRKVLPPVRDAGHRVICPDLPGFGRSEKPTDIGWYTYDRLTACASGLMEALDVRGATFVVHDWGGPIGLRVALEHPGRVDRLVVMDTGLFTGTQRMSEAWHAFAGFVRATEDLPVGALVRGGCHRDPGDDVVAAYDAPFGSPAEKAGARALPLLIPHDEASPDAATGRRLIEALRADARPMLLLWAEHDPVLPPEVGDRFAAAIGREPPRRVPCAGHFLQEDQGELVGTWIADWLALG
jgi:haloalkane dehalogenase